MGQWLLRSENSVFMMFARSLFPVTALIIITGTLWWGPWASLAITLIWWRIVARIG